MNNLILATLLLTVSMAFAHENEHDPKHNAIHHAYIGKICHAHTYGNDTVQGDLHWHENSYRFSDDDHNQKLSNYYLDLHDVNNPNNLTHFERFVIHGLHTLDYIVTPPVQIDGKIRRITPDAPLKAIEPEKRYAKCPIGWVNRLTMIDTPEVLIGAIGYEWVSDNGRGHYSIKSVEIYASQADYDLTGWVVDVKPIGAMQSTKIVIEGTTNTAGFLRVEMDARVGEHPINRMMQFQATLIYDSRHIDTVRSCYLKNVPYQTFRESGRIERIIPQYELDAGISSLLGSEWNDYYRSEWKAIMVASAPTLRKPKLTTMWAELKKQ